MADNTYASSQGDEYDSDYDDIELFTCPHCGGFGHVECHCGGDLCVCSNYGEETCGVCGGEGEITAERYDRYEEAQRRSAAAWTKASAKAGA